MPLLLPPDVNRALLAFMPKADRHSLRATCKWLYGAPNPGGSSLRVPVDNPFALAAFLRRAAWVNDLPFWAAGTKRVVLMLSDLLSGDVETAVEFARALAALVPAPEIVVAAVRYTGTPATKAVRLLNRLAARADDGVWPAALFELKAPDGLPQPVSDISADLRERLVWCSAPIIGDLGPFPVLRNVVLHHRTGVAMLHLLTQGLLPAVETVSGSPDLCTNAEASTALAAAKNLAHVDICPRVYNHTPSEEVPLRLRATALQHNAQETPWISGGQVQQAAIKVFQHITDRALDATVLSIELSHAVCLAINERPALRLDRCTNLALQGHHVGALVKGPCALRLVRAARFLRVLSLNIQDIEPSLVGALPATLVELNLTGVLDNYTMRGVARLLRARLPSRLRSVCLPEPYSSYESTCALVAAAVAGAREPCPTVYMDQRCPYVVENLSDAGPGVRIVARSVMLVGNSFQAPERYVPRLGWRTEVTRIYCFLPLGPAFWGAQTPERVAAAFPCAEEVVLQGGMPLSFLDVHFLGRLCIALGSRVRRLETSQAFQPFADILCCVYRDPAVRSACPWLLPRSFGWEKTGTHPVARRVFSAKWTRLHACLCLIFGLSCRRTRKLLPQ